MPNALGFLNPNKQIAIPTGGDFVPSGFIGETMAQVYFKFMAEIDIDDGEHDEIPKPARKAKAGESWFNYYYATQSEANAAMEMLGIEGYNGKKPFASMVWSLMVNTKTVMNFADPTKLGNFPETIVGDVEMVSWRSKKFANFQLIALPLAVQAAAKALGYEYAPLDISELTRLDQAFTDDFQFSMIGHPDAKKGDEQYYKNSKLYKSRAALWASLGESNPDVYNPSETESEKLQNCLSVVTSQWDSPVLARVIQVFDPHADATYKKKSSGEDAHSSIFALFEIFIDPKNAQEAARADVERAKKNADAKASANGSGAGYPVPAYWKENNIAEDWQPQAAKIVAEHPAMPGVGVLNKLARTYSASVEEIKALWK